MRVLYLLGCYFFAHHTDGTVDDAVSMRAFAERVAHLLPNTGFEKSYTRLDPKQQSRLAIKQTEKTSKQTNKTNGDLRPGRHHRISETKTIKTSTICQID
jgi:hypothetical protein